MNEPHWPDDIPPPYAALYQLGQRCLDEVNAAAQRWPPSTRVEHELVDIARSQALAISTLSVEVLRLRHEHHALAADSAEVEWRSCRRAWTIRFLQWRQRYRTRLLK